MAPTLYPRGTLKKTIKAHANRPLSKNVDILVRPPSCSHTHLAPPPADHCLTSSIPADYTSANARDQIYLNYILFMQDLMQEAGIKAKQSGERGISAKSIKRVREGCLRKAKG